MLCSCSWSRINLCSRFICASFSIQGGSFANSDLISVIMGDSGGRVSSARYNKLLRGFLCRCGYCRFKLGHMAFAVLVSAIIVKKNIFYMMLFCCFVSFKL